jgi:hypothetical protein
MPRSSAQTAGSRFVDARLHPPSGWAPRRYDGDTPRNAVNRNLTVLWQSGGADSPERGDV